MPRYYVGLDFGTHQTKVCVKDTKINSQPYRFIEFQNMEGKEELMVPSVVQLNKDGSVSYGFVCNPILNNNSLLKFNKEQPLLAFPVRPIYQTKRDKITFKLANLVKTIFGKADTYDFDLEVKIWEEKCEELRNSHAIQMELWKKERKSFNQNIERLKSQAGQNYRIRYFKLAVFNDEYARLHSQDYKISPEKASILYIAFILFCIEETIGNDFFLQMGIPSGKNREEFNRQSSKAYRIMISANELKKQYLSKKKYLAAPLEDLIRFSSNKDERNVDDYELGMQAVPEAYAGLTAISRNRRLSAGGIHLHIDIGGGTTDVSLFTLGEKGNDAEIYSVTSFFKGLNNIIENSQFKEDTTEEAKLNKFKESNGDLEIFTNPINGYLRELDNELNKIIVDLQKSFERIIKGRIPVSQLQNAILKQPRVYCGGGAMYSKLLNSRVKYFLDQRILTKESVAPDVSFINDPKKIEKIFTLLVVAYGLSNPITSEEIIQKESLEMLFKQLRSKMDHVQNPSNSHMKRDIRDYDD